MSGYAKLFSDIVDSSIWKEDSDTCKVWITLLALADADGFVRGSDGWLADKSKVELAKCIEAVSKFCSPDPCSRTPDNEGRRVERLEDGYLVLNYLAFRDRLSNDPKVTATRERVRKHREKYAGSVTKRYVTQEALQSVTSLVSASASASVLQEEGSGEKPSLDYPLMIYEAYPLKAGKPAALLKIRKALEKIEPEKLLGITRAFAASIGNDKEFCPHPATWFHQERFNDDPTTWRRNTAASGNGIADRIFRTKALERIEERLKFIRGQQPLDLDSPLRNEQTALKAERAKLMTELQLKA